MAETKRRVTPSFPPPAMDKITSKRPPATSTASNLKAKIWPSFCWLQLCFGGRDLFGTNGCGVTRCFWSVFFKEEHVFLFWPRGKKRTWNKKHDVSWSSCVYLIQSFFFDFPSKLQVAKSKDTLILSFPMIPMGKSASHQLATSFTKWRPSTNIRRSNSAKKIHTSSCVTRGGVEQFFGCHTLQF